MFRQIYRKGKEYPIVLSFVDGIFVGGKEISGKRFYGRDEKGIIVVSTFTLFPQQHINKIILCHPLQKFRNAK